MTLEGTNLLEPETFDEDPRGIYLPPLDGDVPKFVLIENGGATLTLDDGSLYNSDALIALNQTNRGAYIHVYKKEGKTFISLVRKDE